MVDFELHGYLTTGKYQVNDYEIEIERVEGGVELRVTDGNTGVTKVAMIHDGDPVISQDEAATIREMFDQLSVAFPEWQDNEQDRKNAERVREAADQARKTLYNQTKALYDALYPKIDQDLAAANAAKAAAEAARDRANQIVNVDFENMMFYHPGDVITIGDGGTAQSTSLNATGYATTTTKYIHLKIPLAKRLDKVTIASCQSFIVSIANSGGFGMSSTENSDGYDFTNNISSIGVDKVQNCLHIALHKNEGFTLKANECVSCRIGKNRNGVPAVKFTLG